MHPLATARTLRVCPWHSVSITRSSPSSPPLCAAAVPNDTARRSPDALHAKPVEWREIVVGFDSVGE